MCVAVGRQLSGIVTNVARLDSASMSVLAVHTQYPPTHIRAHMY